MRWCSREPVATVSTVYGSAAAGLDVIERHRSAAARAIGDQRRLRHELFLLQDVGNHAREEIGAPPGAVWT